MTRRWIFAIVAACLVAAPAVAAGAGTQQPTADQDQAVQAGASAQPAPAVCADETLGAALGFEALSAVDQSAVAAKCVRCFPREGCPSGGHCTQVGSANHYCCL